ncbi:MAG: flagellar biosynthetic protein FliQ [Hydrogenophaga sp.]|uniref:flagellar biosynthetic protein FliQ n=1 Tax=Hydrogenophaga sp. TaxID=1904254 RepID=UPI002616E083|nr:flagellar biosynthetic protein FliQ [Hydrogenophaga sp.]MDM7942418.1 flagellar biosynthetic protein FliQ [Hydrogenophaga sp.]
MDTSLVIELVLLALKMAVVLAGPILLAVLVVGVVLGALQSATQINEPSVVFVPKILAVMVVIALTGPVSLTLYVDYLREMILRIPDIAG